MRALLLKTHLKSCLSAPIGPCFSEAQSNYKNLDLCALKAKGHFCVNGVFLDIILKGGSIYYFIGLVLKPSTLYIQDF